MLSWGILSGATAFVARRIQLLPRALPARHRRSRVLPGHHLLSDAVVPGGLSRAASSATSWRRSRSPRCSARRCRARCSGWTASPGCMAGSGCSSSRRCRPLILSVVVFFYLTDRPADATWLPTEGRVWLADRLEQERARTRRRRSTSRVARRCSIRGCWRSAWSISARWPATTASASSCRRSSKASALTNLQTGFVTAIPYVDRHRSRSSIGAGAPTGRGERKLHTALRAVRWPARASWRRRSSPTRR